jgi:uncharacterized membrane protein HdeD (DUF308 family)
MVQLLLLLCGSRIIRGTWRVVLLFGILLMLLGILFIVDALIDEIRVPAPYYSIPLFVFGSGSLLSGLSKSGAPRTLRLVKGCIFLGSAVVIFFEPPHSGMLIGIVVGVFFIVDACCRAFFAYLVRFEGWRFGMGFAAVEFLSGLWSLVPWPTRWAGEVGEDAGMLLVLSAAGVCALALRIRRLPPDRSILSILDRGWPPAHRMDDDGVEGAGFEGGGGEVIVHVWTPTGKIEPVNRGISRYVAALDEKGVILTGHAALEAPPDIYISLYPAVEIDRTGAEFSMILNAGRDNDVPGVFQPDYAQESADWCPSTTQVRFRGLNVHAVKRFWDAYKEDTSYNLTNRSCAGSVAKALDAGLEGIYEKEIRSSAFFLFRLIFTLELWIAGFIRHRAAATAWTPGLILDYAGALWYVLESQSLRSFTEHGVPEPE